MFDKALLSMGGSIGGLLLLVNGYYASKNRGWRCDWEKEVEQLPPPIPIIGVGLKHGKTFQ